MIRISDIRLAGKYDASELRHVAAGILGIHEDLIGELKIGKLSVDARRKPDVHFVYSLLASPADERGVLSKLPPTRIQGNSGIQILSHPKVSPYDPPERYEFPSLGGASPEKPPVVVGAGPAGLFASLCLAEAGIKCIILERGQPVERRIEDVERFRCGAGFDPSSNVQFGEGGAGTFSDGKLTTGINDKRVRYVLERLCGFGAPEEIMYLAKPHIGTDRLRIVVRAIRERLIELGCDIRFGHSLADIDISGGRLKSVTVQGGGATYDIAADALVLAPGNSARDTFEMLLRRGARLSPKSFSVGVRIEHLQRDIDFAQYGEGMTLRPDLPSSDYKLATHLLCNNNNRSAYTFCVCPGGQVVSSSSEMGGVVTNGMSHFARDGENCNGALLVSVTPDDFGYNPLDGMAFQRKLEQTAFAAGGNNYHAPAQLVGDFVKKRASSRQGKITPTYMPGVRYCNLWDVLPEFVCETLQNALAEFTKRIACFADPNAILTAVETRSSSPVRIGRENFETIDIQGIYPCGEGSGHAGGIMSSAVDGIKSAEAMVWRI